MADCARLRARSAAAEWPPPPVPPPSHLHPLALILLLCAVGSAVRLDVASAASTTVLHYYKTSSQASRLSPRAGAPQVGARDTLCRLPARPVPCSAVPSRPIPCLWQSKGVRKAELDLELWRKPWRAARRRPIGGPSQDGVTQHQGPLGPVKSQADSSERDRLSPRPYRPQPTTTAAVPEVMHLLCSLASYGAVVAVCLCAAPSPVPSQSPSAPPARPSADLRGPWYGPHAALVY